MWPRLLFLVLILPARVFALFDGEFEEEPRCECAKPDAPAGDGQNKRWALEAARIGFLSLSPAANANLKNPGLGARYDISLRIPSWNFLNREYFDIRPGVFAGGIFHAISSDTGSGEMAIVLGVFYAAMDFHKFWARATPYVAFGGGGAYVFIPANATLAGVVQPTNFWATSLYGAMGLKYYLGHTKKWFLRIEISAIETIADSKLFLLQGNFGVGYRFGKRVWD